MRARNKRKIRVWKVYFGYSWFVLVEARTFGAACRKAFKRLGFTPKSTHEGGFESVTAELMQ